MKVIKWCDYETFIQLTFLGLGKTTFPIKNYIHVKTDIQSVPYLFKQ